MRGVLIAVALLTTGAARAQETRLPATPRYDVSELRTIDMHRYCGRRSNRIGSVMPPAAVEQGKGGNAVTDCAIGADNKVTSCAIVSAVPYMFAQSALKLSCRMTVDVAGLERGEGVNEPGKTEFYRTAEGWRARLTFNFEVRD